MEVGWLNPCPALHTLHLANNNLKLLDSNVLTGGRSLVRLDLTNNLISSLPNLASSNKLEQLSLPFNPLHTFSFCEVSKLSILSSLNLSNTNLVSVEPCGDTLRSLHILDLSANYLSFPMAELLALPNLRHLSAGQKNISVFSKTSFAGLDNLDTVQLDNCPELKSIEPGLFASLLFLERLTIQGNPQLEFLPVGLVVAGSRTLSVDLSMNGLTWIDPGSLPWDRVVDLDLSNNQLHCDCRIAWMISALRKIDNHTALCFIPDQFTGVSISELSEDEFKCVVLGPLQVSVLSVCLVMVSLALGIIGFLIYRHKKAAATISDFPAPGYLQQHYKGGCELGWVDKQNGYSDEDWAYLQPKCSCRDVYEVPQGHHDSGTMLTASNGTLRYPTHQQQATILDISSTFRRADPPSSRSNQPPEPEAWSGSPPLVNQRNSVPSLLSDYFLPVTDPEGQPFPIPDLGMGGASRTILGNSHTLVNGHTLGGGGVLMSRLPPLPTGEYLNPEGLSTPQPNLPQVYKTVQRTSNIQSNGYRGTIRDRVRRFVEAEESSQTSSPSWAGHRLGSVEGLDQAFRSEKVEGEEDGDYLCETLLCSSRTMFDFGQINRNSGHASVTLRHNQGPDTNSN